MKRTSDADTSNTGSDECAWSCRERYRRKSTLTTAQLPVAAWHEMIGEATLADAILDRIVHNAHRITLEGDSMRKRKTPTLLTGAEITEINHP